MTDEIVTRPTLPWLLCCDHEEHVTITDKMKEGDVVTIHFNGRIYGEEQLKKALSKIHCDKTKLV